MSNKKGSQKASRGNASQCSWVQEQRLELLIETDKLEAEEKAFGATRQENDRRQALVAQCDQKTELNIKELSSIMDPTALTKWILRDRPSELKAYGHLELAEVLFKIQEENRSLQRKLDQAKYDEGLKQTHGGKFQKCRKGRHPLDLIQERDRQRLLKLEEEVKVDELHLKELKRSNAEAEKLIQQEKDKKVRLKERVRALEEKKEKETERKARLEQELSSELLLKRRQQAELEKNKRQLNKTKKKQMENIAELGKNISKTSLNTKKFQKKLQELTLQYEVPIGEAQLSNEEVRTESKGTAVRKTCQHLMKVTGVSDVGKLAEFFSSQEERLQRLEEEKGRREKMLQPERETPEVLIQQLQDMGGVTEVRREELQKQVEDSKRELKDAQLQLVAVEKRFHQQNRTFSDYRARLENLALKLKHIHLPEDSVVQVSPDSDQYLLVLKAECEMKLQTLQQKFEGKDLSAIEKEMEEAKYLDHIQREMQVGEISDKASEDQGAEDSSDESDEKVENHADVLSRKELKVQSQRIIDANSRKGRRKKKK